MDHNEIASSVAKKKLQLLKEQIRLASLEADYEDARDRLHSDPREENVATYKATGNKFQKAREEYRLSHAPLETGRQVEEPVQTKKPGRFKRWFGGS
jgi:hypothetical protein